jgi:hypothetical protein
LNSIGFVERIYELNPEEDLTIHAYRSMDGSVVVVVVVAVAFVAIKAIVAIVLVVVAFETSGDSFFVAISSFHSFK